jgi:hypothetical protein
MRIALVSIFVWYNYIACFNTNVIRIKVPHRQSSSKMNTENHRNRAKLDSPNTYVHGRAYIYTSHGTGTSPNLIPRTHMYMAAQSYMPGLVQALPRTHMYMAAQSYIPGLVQALPRTHMYMAAQSYIPGLVQALPKLDSLNTHVHGRPIIYSGLGTSTSILSEGLYSFMKPNLYS